MAAIIENQYIAKRGISTRRKSSTFRPINKSASFNSEIMSHLHQKPAKKKKEHYTLADLIGMILKKTGPCHGKIHTHKIKRKKKTLKKNTDMKSGLVFTTPSVATLAAIAGIVVLALIALNWKGTNVKAPKEYIFQPSGNEDIETQKRIYAQTGNPNILDTFQSAVAGQAPETTENSTTETHTSVGISNTVISNTTISNVNNEDEAPHELMVTFQWHQYKVQKGDVVGTIARKFGVSESTVIASNGIRNVRLLQEGATLRIPSVDGMPHIAKKGESYSSIAAKYEVPLEAILDINDIKSDLLKEGESIFIPGARMNDMDLSVAMGNSFFTYPVSGKVVTSEYGMRRDPFSQQWVYHKGIDLRGNLGATVMAAMDGVVSVVKEDWLYGKYVILTHSNGFKTLYAHLSTQSVKEGDRVSQGRKIGEVGNTGHSTGPHLHFSIFDQDGKDINPLSLLK